ncbi:MAG: hypothetical protein ABI137_14135 [Antricoccus sp.]
MAQRKGPGPSVKDDKVYGKLRDEGNSKEKSARIANAMANSSREQVSKKADALAHMVIGLARNWMTAQKKSAFAVGPR